MKKFILTVCMMLLISSIILLTGCKKENDKHPEIQTLDPVAVSTGKVLFKGNIIHTGSFSIKDYGFIYNSNSSPDENNGLKVSLGQDAQEGEYSKEVNSLLSQVIYGNTIYVRAYITNDNGTVYGAVASVNLPTPSVSVLNPTSGQAGDKITLSGDFYTSDQQDVQVLFNNIPARTLELSPAKMVVEVPSGIQASHNSQINVALKVGARQYTISNTFRIMALVKDFSPKSGMIGTTVSFSGQNLPNYSYDSAIKVFFGDTEAYVNSYNNPMTVTVPATVTAENLKVAVVINGVRTELPGDFKITPPVLSSLSVYSALAGSSFEIRGSGFANLNNSGMTVKLGKTTIGAYVSSATLITATVPTDMVPGDYKLTFINGPHTLEAPQIFTVITPVIESFSPLKGAPSSPVTITGSFRSGQYYSVSFGNLVTGGYSNSSNSIQVTVPYGIEPGKVKISVQFPGKTVTTATEFTVTSATITSFSPVSGIAGTEVTILGEGFNTSQGSTVVKFGTIETRIISISTDKIKVLVPSNLNPGAMKISVQTNGQTVISSNNFTATNQ